MVTGVVVVVVLKHLSLCVCVCVCVCERERERERERRVYNQKARDAWRKVRISRENKSHLFFRKKE